MADGDESLTSPPSFFEGIQPTPTDVPRVIRERRNVGGRGRGNPGRGGQRRGMRGGNRSEARKNRSAKAGGDHSSREQEMASRMLDAMQKKGSAGAPSKPAPSKAKEARQAERAAQAKRKDAERKKAANAYFGTPQGGEGPESAEEEDDGTGVEQASFDPTGMAAKEMNDGAERSHPGEDPHPQRSTRRRKTPDAPPDYVARRRTVAVDFESQVMSELLSHYDVEPMADAVWELFPQGGDSEDYNVVSEDALIFLARYVFKNMAYPAAMTVSGKPIATPATRLYMILKYVLSRKATDVSEVNGINFDGEAELAEANLSRSWRALVDTYGDDPVSLFAYKDAVTEIDLNSGSKGTKGSRKVSLLLEKLFPHFSLALAIATVFYTTAGTKTITTTSDEDGKTKTVYPLVELFTKDEFGFVNAAKAAEAVSSGATGGPNNLVFPETLRRLIKYGRYFASVNAAQTVFSASAERFLRLFKSGVILTPDESPKFHDVASSTQYGNFESREAFLACLLAVNEIELIRMCIVTIKTRMLLQSSQHGGTSLSDDSFLTSLMEITSSLAGYSILRVMGNPSKPEYAAILHARISNVSSLGSLAAIWLATKRAYSYEALVTAGSTGTEQLQSYARVVPYIRALLLFGAKENPFGASASITTSLVIKVFSNLAMSMVQTAPGFTSGGTHETLGAMEQNLVTTLFYGVLTVDSFKETMYQESVVDPVGGDGDGVPDTGFDYTRD